MSHPVLAHLDEPQGLMGTPAPVWLRDLSEWMKPCEETDGVCRSYAMARGGWRCIDCDRELPPIPSERLLLMELLRTREALRDVVSHSLPSEEAA